MAEQPTKPQAPEAVQSSISMRLNARLFFRLVGIFLLLDVILCLLCAGGMAVWADGRAAEILRACKGYVFALAVEGKGCSSERLSEKLGALADAGREITFVIGSSCGLDQSVKARADEMLSFSQMTFPHQLMRVILAEQIYRAFMIRAGAEYHK